MSCSKLTKQNETFQQKNHIRTNIKQKLLLNEHYIMQNKFIDCK